MSGGTWIRNVLWLLLLACILYVGTRIRNTLTVFAVGFLIAYLLNPFVELLRGRRLGPIREVSRLQSILLVYLLLLGFLVAAGFLIVPLAVEQTQAMVSSGPQVVAKVQLKAYEIQEQYMKKVPAQVRSQVEHTLAQSTERLTLALGTGLQYLANFVLGAISGVVLLLTGLIIALYVLVNWHQMLDYALDLVPYDYRDDARSLAVKMNQIFGGYLRATILCCAACGVATFLCLTLLSAMEHFPYALLVSLVAGVTYPIPVVGILSSGILGGVLAYGSTGKVGFSAAVLVTVIVVNQIIDRTLAPKLMGEAIGVSALFILFAAFAGGEFLGPTGMLLGIPLAAIAKALLAWFHGRFLVAPEEEVRQSTQEIWKRVADPEPSRSGIRPGARRIERTEAPDENAHSAENVTPAAPPAPSPASSPASPWASSGATPPGAAAQAPPSAPDAASASTASAGQASAVAAPAVPDTAASLASAAPPAPDQGKAAQTTEAAAIPPASAAPDQGASGEPRSGKKGGSTTPSSEAPSDPS